MFNRAVILAAAALIAGSACNRTAQKKPEPESAAPPPASTLPAAPEPLMARSQSHRLAPGIIKVKILDVLDSGTPIGGLVRASIVDDVKGADSQLAIPAGASALVSPLLFGKAGDVSQIGLSLYSVDLDGRQMLLTGEDRNPATTMVTVDSARNPVNKTVHISAGDILDFTLRKPAELH